MNKIVKELCIIAKQIDKIENSKTASMHRNAGLWNKIFGKGLDEKNREEIDNVLKPFIDDPYKTLWYICGEPEKIKNALMPLSKIKQTTGFFDKIMKWFASVSDQIPKSTRNKAKRLEQENFIEQIKNGKLQDGTQLSEDELKAIEPLKKFADQMSKKLQQIKQELKNIQVEAGEATQTWGDALTGFDPNIPDFSQ